MEPGTQNRPTFGLLDHKLSKNFGNIFFRIKMATFNLGLATFFLGLATFFLGMATFFLGFYIFQFGNILVRHAYVPLMTTLDF